MNKIINFSSVYEEQCVEARIFTIKKELNKEHISSKKLLKLQEELHHLSLEITKTMQTQASLTHHAMSLFLKTQAELGSLIYACQNLFIDKKVDKLTEHAQRIAKESLNPGKNVFLKIGKLQKSILSLTCQEALSLENRQMIDLAKKYLHDAEARCYQETALKGPKAIRLDFQKINASQDLLDPYDISIELYEVAGDFYHYQIHQAVSAFFSLAPSVQSAVNALLLQKGIRLDALKHSQNLAEWSHLLNQVLQTLLGYSNQLLYGSYREPSVAEIQSLFKDLDAILKEESSANF
jgi:hypothetical protein